MKIALKNGRLKTREMEFLTQPLINDAVVSLKGAISTRFCKMCTYLSALSRVMTWGKLCFTNNLLCHTHLLASYKKRDVPWHGPH